MKILSVNKFFWRKGGSEVVFFKEKEMLENGGHQVIPFSMKSDKNEESIFSDFFVEEVDYQKSGIRNRVSCASKVLFSFDARAKMKAILKEIKPDLAHFHVFQHQISPSVFGPLRKMGIPIVLTLHDLKPLCPSYKNYVNGKVCEACKGGKFYNCFRNKCTKGSRLGSFVNGMEMYLHYALGYYQNVDRYIAVSRFYRQKMIESGFPKEQISYLPNFVDEMHSSNSVSKTKYILYFGRLSEEKGILTLLNAAVETPEVTYYVAGTGPMEHDLRKEVIDRRIFNVSFLGYKEGGALKELLSESLCVVVPSEGYENCPMTVLEAFAAGVPTIGSDIGGVPELIVEESDGLLFQPGNSQDLVRKIRRLWHNPDMARKMGLKGREKIGKHFNAESHYEGLLAIYKSVLGADS